MTALVYWNEASCEWMLASVMFLGGIHELFRLHLSESRTSLMNEILLWFSDGSEQSAGWGQNFPNPSTSLFRFG